MKWTADQIPSLKGKTAIVTGANVGLGLEIATQLACHGAHTVLACRNPAKAHEALDGVKAKLATLSDDKKGSVETMQIDCGSLASVRKFNEEVKAKFKSLDLLILNAGGFHVSGRCEVKIGSFFDVFSRCNGTRRAF